MAPTFMDMPTEIIINIYRYLNFRDIESMTLTCRRFYEISKYKEFSSKISLQLSKNEDIEYILKNDNLPDKFPQNLQICYIDKIDLLDKILHKFKDHLYDLTLKDVPIINTRFIQIFKNLENLKTITLEDYDFNIDFNLRFCENDFKELPSKIKSFTLKQCHLTGNVVLCFINVFENLECFKILNCYGRGFADTTIIFKNLPKTLKELHINTPDIERWRHDGGFFQDVRQVESLKHLNLKKLTYCSGNRFKDEDLLLLLHFQKNLTYLDLSNYLYLTDESIFNIVETLKYLEVLKLKKCLRLTDNAIIALSNIKNLKSLDISNCQAITSHGLTEGIAKNKNDKIEELLIAHNSEITENGILQCVENFCNLQIFDIQFCQVTNRVIESIIKNLKNLKELNLSHCSEISDDAFVSKDRIFSTSNSLLELSEDISKQPKSSSSSLLIEPSLWLGPLKGLQSLNLDSCYNITDTTLIYGFRCLNLKCLNLRKCRITSKGLHALSRNCPSIEKLILSECEFINDNAIHIILRQFHRIRMLNVRDCQISCDCYKQLTNKIPILRY